MPSPTSAEQERRDAIKKALAEYDAALALIETGIFKIRAAGGGMVTFVPKDFQRKLYKHIRSQMADGKQARIIILKGRQMGFSTAIAILFLALSIVREAVVTLVVAHEKKAADKIFSIYRRALHHLPEDKLPKTEYDSMRHVVFEDTEAEIAVEVAVQGKLGRSDTVTYAHFSEYAWWKEQPETLQAALSAIPEVVGTIAIIETTANGWGDDFHGKWLGAEASWRVLTKTVQAEKSNWEPFFAPWFWEKAYRTRIPEGFELNTDEAAYLREFKLDRTQANWRRGKLVSDCGNDERLFDREFPGSPERAFAATGEAVFDPEALERQFTKFATEPEGTFDVGIAVNNEPFCVFRAEGFFRIYRRPEDGHEYIVVGDPTHNQGSNSDDAAAHVIDSVTREVVASLSGPVGAHEFGDVLVGMAKMYNGAYIIVESNIGKVTVERITRDLRYGNIHYYQKPGNLDSGPSWEMGFSTNVKTRGDMIHTSKRLIREDLVVIYDKPTLMELREFKEVEKGEKKKAMAPRGKQDNLVMALMIGFYVAAKRHSWLSGDNMAINVRVPVKFHQGFAPAKDRKAEMLKKLRKPALAGAFGTGTHG